MIPSAGWPMGNICRADAFVREEPDDDEDEDDGKEADDDDDDADGYSE